MRVTGGIYRGRPLRTTPGLTARPTTDKIRQAIFNILMNDIEEKTVLDIFAGSGALGIEALSHGAVAATFIEIAHAQAQAIRSNLHSLGLKEEVLEFDYIKGCRRLFEENKKFDLIFADPPYNEFTPNEIIDTILEYNLLAPEGFLIIEHKSGLDIRNDRMTLLKTRKFGQTEVTFYARKKEQ